jgi:hypothetical protein
MDKAADQLTQTDIERIEKQALRWAFRAIADYAGEAWLEFRNSPDDADGVAEDVTREALVGLQGYNLDVRLYGRVDYRRTRYVILPELLTRQALFVDSKAEKSGSAGRLQTNQSSIRIAFRRPDGTAVDIPGAMDPIIMLSDGHPYLATTIFVHYHYREKEEVRTLRQIIVAGLPNGQLEANYVSDPDNTIWRVGPDAPTRGEAQRARLSFSKLAERKTWRVQRISFNDDGTPSFTWED